MRYLALVVILGLYQVYAQCGSCTVNQPNSFVVGFDPIPLVLTAGVDTEVVIQFALPDTVMVGGFTLYPNYAVYVDSLRMASGTQYVVLRGTGSTPVGYNTAAPGNGALRFDQDHRYKQVGASSYANVVIYRNPSPSEAGVGSGQLSPPRGCVRACIRGINLTPAGQGDSLIIWLRAFVDPNTIDPFTGQTNDISNKDTTELSPQLAGQPLYSDVPTAYGPIYVVAQTTVLEQALQGGIMISPNPSWGAATLRYQLNYPTPVTISVYTPAGQKVYEHQAGMLAVGSHTHLLSLPAGVYIVQVHAGAETEQARLVIVE